jgi:hypothetical protein
MASFIIAPLLIHADFSKPLILEMDTSNFVLNTVLSQFEKDNLLHPIGFHSHKFAPIEFNYKIHDKKKLAIMDDFEEWCHLFEKTQHEIIVYSDHKNL